MPNFPGPLCGQQAVTTVPTPLPSLIPGNPLTTGANAPLTGPSVRGEGWRVKLTCLKAGTASLFYGNNNNVTTTGANAGKEVAPGNQDSDIIVNDLAQIFVVAAGNGTSVASWSMSPY